MAAWQIVLLVGLGLLPLLLLAVQHPARERLSARGIPMARQWHPAPPPPPVDDHH